MIKNYPLLWFSLPFVSFASFFFTIAITMDEMYENLDHAVEQALQEGKQWSR